MITSVSHIVMPPLLEGIALSQADQLMPDIKEAQRFLNAIDSLAEKHFFQTFSDEKGKDKGHVSQKFTSLDDTSSGLSRLNAAGAGVFVTVNETDGKGRAAKNISKIRALYFDFDDADTALARVEKISAMLAPSIVVESSPGLRHVYYLVSDLSIGDAQRWLKHIIALAGSDRACSDISRVMRLPGFIHRKREPFMTRILSIANDGSPIPYTVAQLEKSFGCPTENIQVALKQKTVKATRQDADSAMPHMVTEGGRNSALASLAGTMRHRGMTEAAILAALLAENQSRSNPPLDDEEVKAIAASISSYPASTEGESSTGETAEQVITRLAALGAIQYDQSRITEAKKLGVRPSTLDKTVRASRGEDAGKIDTPFVEVDVWPEQIDPAGLLTEIASTIRRHIICDTETACAAALWTAMTYMVEQFDIAPLAVITAPEPRCGKSEFRRLLGQMVCRPLHADGMSASVLFRAFDLWHPTLLIDEYDTFVGENEDLRGVINAGHQRGGQVWRCVGDNHDPKGFNVFGPKLMAGIGKLPATIADRSIIFELRRKLSTESIMRQRDVEKGFFLGIQQRLMRFAEDYADCIGATRPVLPFELNDRQQDNWEPLFQIAEVAGGDWPSMVKTAALKLSAGKENMQSRRVELLADIKEIFDVYQDYKAGIPTAKLIELLCLDSEMPWATYGRGFPISPRQLAGLLKEFGIGSGSIRIASETGKGYQVAHFNDAFARYL